MISSAALWRIIFWCVIAEQLYVHVAAFIFTLMWLAMR